MKELVDQISARLRDQKIEVPDEEIESRLKKLIEDFRVPEGEARRSVLNYFFKEHGVVPAGQGQLGEGQDLRDQGIRQVGGSGGQGFGSLGAGY